MGDPTATKDQLEEYEYLMKQKEEKLAQIQESSRHVREAQQKLGGTWSAEQEKLDKAKKELDYLHSKIMELEKRMGKF